MAAQNATFTLSETTFRGRPAWEASNGVLSITITKTGCHLGRLVALADPLLTNPLWEPLWPSGDPASAAASGTWGSGEHAVEAPLLTSICGSNLCADRFGAPHPGEERPLHGEAGVVEWAPAAAAAAGSQTVTFTAYLPLARLQATRAFALLGNSLTITSALEDRAGRGRDVEICEHTTLGGAFLDHVADGGALTASVDAGAEMTGSEAAPAVDVGEALRVPARAAPPAGTVRTLRVSEPDAWWLAAAPALGWQLRASWSRADFPFLCVWTEHLSRHHAPWAGRERTRGMEVRAGAAEAGLFLSPPPVHESPPPAHHAARRPRR